MTSKMIAVLAALLLLAAACGSSSEEGEAPAAAEPAAEPAPAEEPTEEPAAAPTEEPAEEAAPAADTGPADDSLDPVRIGLLNQENDPIGSFPEFRFGVEGAVDYLNAEKGGVDGHPIELVTCVQNSVEAAQNCAQDLATGELVSVINGINIWTFAFDFYGTMGETPVIGGLPLFAGDYNAPNARYFNGGSVAVYAGMARFAAEDLGATSVAVLLNDNPAASAAVDAGLAPIFDQFGVEFSQISVPLPLSDAIPPVSQAVEADADYVMLLASGGECVPVARAASQLGIPAEQMIYSGGCTAAEVLAEVGDLMVGSYVHKGGYTAEDTWADAEILAELDSFEGLIDTYAPDAPDAQFTGLGWATMSDIHDLYEELGYEALADPANIFAATDDGTTRGGVGSFGWACVFADIDLASVCQGDNLFLQIADADGTTNPPAGGGFTNGLDLLRE